MNAKFAKTLYTHHSINEKTNSPLFVCFANGGGGGKSCLCITHYPLNFNFSLYILLYCILTFLCLKFLVIASECKKFNVLSLRADEIGVAIYKIKNALSSGLPHFATLVRNDGRGSVSCGHFRNDTKGAHFQKFSSNFYLYFYTFKTKFNAFYTSYPSFRSVQTDKKFYFKGGQLCLNRNL